MARLDERHIPPHANDEGRGERRDRRCDREEGQSPSGARRLAPQSHHAEGSRCQRAKDSEVEVDVDERGQGDRRLNRTEQPRAAPRAARENETLEGERQEAQPEEIEVPVGPGKTRRCEGKAQGGDGCAEVPGPEPPREPEHAGAGDREGQQHREVVGEWQPGNRRYERRGNGEGQAERVRRKARPLRCP